MLPSIYAMTQAHKNSAVAMSLPEHTEATQIT